ncbi:MAG TPA: DNA recombination protein RmuC, partial [Aquabacterium sp.]|nr:DNA recombination protein RmuC [Aquabacterium sp.]
MNWILIALLVLNLLLLLWLMSRPAKNNDEALLKLGADLTQELRQRSDQVERNLRDELSRSAGATRQEQGSAMAGFQQTLVAQLGDATRTQNEQLDSFRTQLAAMQQGLSDALRDTTHQQGLQAAGLREAQATALARFNEAQEAALRRLGDGVTEQLRVLSEANDRRQAE